MIFRSLSRLIILVVGVVILAELIAEDKPKKKATESDAEGTAEAKDEGEESAGDEDSANKEAETPPH